MYMYIYIQMHLDFKTKNLQPKTLHCVAPASGGTTEGVTVIKSVDLCVLMRKFFDYSLVYVPLQLLPRRHLWRTVQLVIFKGLKLCGLGS